MIYVGSQSLDDLFELRIAGDPALGGLPSGSTNPTGILPNGQDLEARYAPIAVSGNPNDKAIATGIFPTILVQVAGDIVTQTQDMREFFCKKGLRPTNPIVSAGNVNETVFGFGGGGTVSGTSTATVTAGGIAPFTYSWQLLSGSVSLQNANTRFCTFSAFVNDGQTVSATARCLVTDSVGNIGISNTISISLTFIGTQ